MISRNYVGQIFGRLQIIQLFAKGKNGNHKYLCKCECGGECTPLLNNLKLGRTRSCGCLYTESIGHLKGKKKSAETVAKMSKSRTFSEEDTNAIENLYSTGEISARQIAKKYDENYHNVLYVVNKMKRKITIEPITEEDFENIRIPSIMRKIRVNNHISGNKIGGHLGVTRQCISLWEKGKIKMPIMYKDRMIEFYKALMLEEVKIDEHNFNLA